MLPLDLFAGLYELSPKAATRLMTFGVSRVLPITKGLDIRIEAVGDARAVASMPLSRRSKNHVGSMYLGATLILAEVTTAS